MRFERIIGPVAVAVLAACSSPQSGSSEETPITHAVASHPEAQVTAVSQEQERELTSSQIDAIVVEVMNQQYGNERSRDGKCWSFKYSDDGLDTDYCMEPRKPELVGPSNRAMYLLASNRSDDTDAFGAVTPGLMGAFQVAIEKDGSWRYVAKAPALPFGTMGYCGCDKAKFVSLGDDYYGWMFTSGGTWQGVTVSNHEIVAPHQGTFKDVSDVPEIREDDQDAIYSIEFGTDSGQAGVRPLKVIKAVSGKVQSERLVPFDEARWEYRMPETF